jgi:hypothetical protein
MTQTNDSSSQISLTKRMLIGAAIGLAVISFFVFGVDQPNPAWGQYWMIKPLILTPLVGAMCGLSNYIIMTYYNIIGLNRIVAMIISGVVFLVGIWIGIVLGLNGTMWN